MSVIVRGMEMPEDCMDCKIKQYDEYEDDCVCPFSGVVCLSIGRQDACPLVALPDHHGRLVDADALRDRLQSLADDGWNKSTTTSWAEAFSECADMVEEMPTIEPRCEACEAFNKTRLLIPQPERKKGEWEMVSQHENPPTYIYSCSECRHKSFGFYNYCPNCGAEMTEGKE